MLYLPHLAAGAALPLPELNVDTAVATAGFYRLEWRLPAATADPGLRYELQEATGSGFQHAVSLYRGPDLARVQSGQRDGVRYYRVRTLRSGQPVSEWSETVRVETRHHSLTRAFSFFALGAIVFVLTLVLVLRGSRMDPV